MRKWFLVTLAIIIMMAPLYARADQKEDKQVIFDELNALSEANPNKLVPIVYLLEESYSKDNNIDRAIALYEKAVNVIKGNEDMLNRLGNLYNQKQDYAKAVVVYQKLVELRPDNVGYVQMLSSAYKNAGQKDKAVSVWENLMKTSKNAEVFLQAANFYNGENELDKALVAVKKAIELAPDNPSYLQTLEGFYMKAEKFTEAEALCNKILSTASDIDQWLKDWSGMELINIYQRQNKIAELAEKFEKDLSQSPKDVSKYRRLVELYQRSNDKDKAIAVYEKAIDAGLNDRDIKNRLVDMYELANKLDKAEEQLKNIISASPQEIYLKERLANLLYTQGKKDEAKETWNEILAKSPADAGMFSRYGDRLNAWGDTDDAVAQYRKAQALDGANLWYTMRIADILIAKGKPDNAKKELNSIITKSKDESIKKEAERKIKDLESVAAVPHVQPGVKETKTGKKKWFFSR